MDRRTFVAAAVSAVIAPAARSQESTEGLDMQAARARMMHARGMKVAYTKKFDLEGLPHYAPERALKGKLRIWGSNYIVDGNVGRYWEEAFRKHHPDVTFD